MKNDWKIILVFSALAFVLNFIFKTSGLTSLAGIDLFFIVFLALFANQGGFSLLLLFILLNVISDLLLLYPVGFLLTSFFMVYLIVNIANNALNFTKKTGVLFNLIILIGTIITNNLLTNMLTAAGNSISFIGILISGCFLIIFQTIIDRLVNKNAY